MQNTFVKIKRLPSSEGLDLPSYATAQSAGMDLMCASQAVIDLAPMQRILVPTGICIELPEGFEAQVRPRSGLAIKNGITVLNSPGTIDADYRGEIGVILINLSNDLFQITRGMRIAQLVIAQFSQISWQEQGQLGDSQRSEKGFGSTGV